MLHHVCEWCGECNPVGKSFPRLCPWCGHRGDVPRDECDCPQCVPAPEPDGGEESIPWDEIPY